MADQKYTVKSGDRMSKIAFEHGFKDYHALYEAQSAAFKKKRPNPEILLEGDEVTLPEKIDDKHAADDKKTQKYIQDTTLPELRIHIKAFGKPLASKDFTVLIESDPYTKAKPYKGTGTTDAKGIAKFNVDPRVTTVVLSFKDPPLECKLLVGSLHPVDEPGGVEQRLGDLGYFCPTPPAGEPKNEGEKADVRHPQAGQEERRGPLSGGREAQSRRQRRRAHAQVAGQGPRALTMREYYVTTNTDVAIAAPMLTVIVRAAFWNPKEVLPPDDADVLHGAETWVAGLAVPAFFALSGKLEPGKSVSFTDVIDLDKKKVQATSKERRTGLAMTGVSWSKARFFSEELNVVTTAVPYTYFVAGGSRAVGEAKIPLWGLGKGEYVLAILPPPNEATEPVAPAGRPPRSRPARSIVTGRSTSRSRSTTSSCSAAPRPCRWTSTAW